MTDKKIKNSLKWDDYFNYDESSPTCLRWRIDCSKNKKRAESINLGDKAGSFVYNKNINKRTAIHVRCNRVTYKVHRVIWEMFNGDIPTGSVIDHLNGDPWDNRIQNLSCKTHGENARNQSMHPTNTTGVVGVAYRKPKGGAGPAWHAYVNCNGIRYEMLFSLYAHGDRAMEKAKEWRESKIKELNIELGALFTDRHIFGEVNAKVSEFHKE